MCRRIKLIGAAGACRRLKQESSEGLCGFVLKVSERWYSEWHKAGDVLPYRKHDGGTEQDHETQPSEEGEDVMSGGIDGPSDKSTRAEAAQAIHRLIV